jgi:hypothetical protein
MDVKVILTHPFPTQPQFTGFDVKGTILFPSTRDWALQNEFTDDFYSVYWYNVIPAPDYIIPLKFSLAQDGGGELLNKDGYTFYLSPWLNLGPEFSAPIFNYSKGKHAQGPDPDSTINAFKLFTKDPERRMFRVTDTIGRTYKISPPSGEFTFGYVVDAYWVPPTKTPVTDPKTDFPFWANAEEGYVLETKQLAPFELGTHYFDDQNPIFPVTVDVLIYKHGDLGFWMCLAPTFLIYPEIIHQPEEPNREIAYQSTTSFPGDGWYRLKLMRRNGTFIGEPGIHPAVIFGSLGYNTGDPPYASTELWTPVFCDIINLEVIADQG